MGLERRELQKKKKKKKRNLEVLEDIEMRKKLG